MYDPVLRFMEYFLYIRPVSHRLFYTSYFGSGTEVLTLSFQCRTRPAAESLNNTASVVYSVLPMFSNRVHGR